MIIPPAPPTVTECLLYQKLRELSTPEDGLAERLDSFVDAVNPLLELVISGPFREYTLHNPAHARKVLHLAGVVIDPLTIEKLTVLDLAIIIMASHLHDLGMALTATERQRIIGSSEFEDEARRWPQLWDDILDTRARHAQAGEPLASKLELRLFQLQEAAISAYLRPRHATPERYSALTGTLRDATSRPDLFHIRGVSFEDELIAVCVSHNLDAGALLESLDPETDRYPRDLVLGGEVVNLQFAGAVLRLADIMDFDAERTPRVLFESLDIAERDLPGAMVTLREWQKHMAVHTLRLSNDELVVSADSEHPAIEQSVRLFCGEIEREIRNTTAVLRRNPDSIASAYQLRVPTVVRPRIRARGYVYKELAFNLDESAIVNLLMGDGLYPESAVAIRELAQNAIDACRVRGLADPAFSDAEVTIRSEVDDDGRCWIVVEDNGIGMDEAVLFDYFFRVGRSYYASPEFKRLSDRGGHRFAPISRFGIGVLSVFLIGERLVVETRNAYSTRGDLVSRVVRVDSRFGLAFVTENGSVTQGTRIRIQLAEREPDRVSAFTRHVANYLKTALARPLVPLAVELGGERIRLEPSTFISLRDGAKEELDKIGVEAIPIDLGRWSEKVFGTAIIFLYQAQDGKLTPGEWPAMRHEDIPRYVRGFRGNRVTVNGVGMSTKKIGRAVTEVLGSVAGAIDVDVVGDESIFYDVARQKVTAQSVRIIRAEVARALRAGLQELQVLDRLDRNAPPRVEPHRPTWGRGWNRTIPDDDLLARVKARLPAPPWETGMHKKIAAELAVSNSAVSRAISYMIDAGEIAPAKSEAGSPRADDNARWRLDRDPL